MSASIAGIYPALLTPMNADYSVNVPELHRLVEWMLGEGVHGLYIAGTSGEGLLLEPAERELIVEEVIKATAGRGKTIVHVGAIGTAEAVQLARHAERCGADAVAAVPPFAFGRNLAGIVAHYSAISKSCGLPLYLYNIPSLTAVHLRAEDVAHLVDLPTVVGLKFSDLNLFEEFRIMSLPKKLDVLHGCDETLLYALMMGAVGGVGLIYNLMPKAFLSLFSLFQQGKWQEANQQQLAISRFINDFIRLADGNYVGLAKGIMKGHGFDLGTARPPNPPVGDDAIRTMIDRARPFWDAR